MFVSCMLCVACCASACGNYSVATPAQVLALEALVRSTALSGGVRYCKAVWAQEYAQALSGSARTPRHSATGDSRREVHASLTHLGRADHRFVRQLLLACLHEPDKLVLRAALPRRARASSPRATEHAHSRARSRAITCRSTAELSFIFVLLSKIGEWFIGTCLHAALGDGPCETTGGEARSARAERSSRRLNRMFCQNRAFDQPLDKWDVPKVRGMSLRLAQQGC